MPVPDYAHGVGWEMFKNMIPEFINSCQPLAFPCICKPGPRFLFYGSIKHSRVRSNGGKSHEDLFLRSAEILKPMLQLIDVDHATTEGLEKIERSLGSKLFDAMAHLAALSSESFYQSKYFEPINIMKCVFTVQTGLNAGSCEGFFVGRTADIEKYDRFLSPVFQPGMMEHCPFVLIHGHAGMGKTYLAQKRLEEKQANYTHCKVYCHQVHGRSKLVVRDALYNLGLILASEIEIDGADSVDTVLFRLKEFLKRHRYVILADDVVESGLAEILCWIPKSSEPCLLVVTTQLNGRDVKEFLSKKTFNFTTFYT